MAVNENQRVTNGEKKRKRNEEQLSPFSSFINDITGNDSFYSNPYDCQVHMYNKFVIYDTNFHTHFSSQDYNSYHLFSEYRRGFISSGAPLHTRPIPYNFFKNPSFSPFFGTLSPISSYFGLLRPEQNFTSQSLQSETREKRRKIVPRVVETKIPDNLTPEKIPENLIPENLTPEKETVKFSAPEKETPEKETVKFSTPEKEIVIAESNNFKVSKMKDFTISFPHGNPERGIVKMTKVLFDFFVNNSFYFISYESLLSSVSVLDESKNLIPEGISYRWSPSKTSGLFSDSIEKSIIMGKENRLHFFVKDGYTRNLTKNYIRIELKGLKFNSGVQEIVTLDSMILGPYRIFTHRKQLPK